MSTQRPDLDFASVVHAASHLPKWSRITDKEDPLVQLHSKFWGKNLTIEEPVLINPRRAESELMDEDKCKEVEDDDNDFIPGCGILNINIDRLPFPRIWIRADYIRIYNYLESRETPPRIDNGLPPAAVVTGQPGIGKTVWVYYALCRRLAERKAVIWYRDQCCHLFLKDGVFRAPIDFPSSYFRFFVWTLVDSDENKEGAPSRLLTPGTRLYVIYVTSPRKDRWSRMHKTVRNVRVIMNPWSKMEINIAASIHSISDSESIDLLYKQFGPTPRLCLDYLVDRDKRTRYELDLRRKISNLSCKTLEKLFRDASALEMDGFSHKICLVSRDNRENVASLQIVEPITWYVKSKIVSQLRTLEQREQVRLYKRLVKTSECRALAGIAFEAVGQDEIDDGPYAREPG